jgi:hypothetical protein
MVLLDRSMPPILGIPQDLGTVSDVLDSTGTILECLWEAQASAHCP